MLIGLTYDLKSDYEGQGLDPEQIAEFDSPAVIDGLEGALKAVGHDVDRIGHIKALVARLARGDRWDLVFNITEGLYGIAREAQVPALLEAYQIPCTLSDAATLALVLDKAMTKRVLRDCGIPTAPFAVVSRPEDIKDVKLGFPLFAKPIAEGSSKGVSRDSKITDAGQLDKVCRHLLQKFSQPVLVEEYLPGREFTVGMLGMGESARVLGMMEVKSGGGKEEVYSLEVKQTYTQDNKADYYHKVEPALYAKIEKLAVDAWRALNCRDGGRLDVRCDARGEPMVLEVNPLAGLCPGYSDLVIIAEMQGIDYNGLVAAILKEALARLGLPASPARKRA